MESSRRDLFRDVVVDTTRKKKPGLKQANTSMSVPQLASYKWAIKHKRNRKTTEKQGLKRPNTSMSVPPLALYKWAIKPKRNRKPQKHKRDQMCIVPF